MQNVFTWNRNIIADILNYLSNSMEKFQVYVWKEIDKSLDGCNSKIELKKFYEAKEVADDNIIYISTMFCKNESAFQRLICSYRHRGDMVIYVGEDQLRFLDFLGEHIIKCKISTISSCTGYICLLGKTFSYTDRKVPDDFKVLAIVHCFNEGDIIEKTAKYLVSQDLDIYFLDNWSEDGTYEKIKNLCVEYPGKIFLERFPSDGKTENYEWYSQLEYTEKICCEYKYNWYIHYDADEIRTGPWKGKTLKETLYHMDCAGYNLAENTVIDFRMTEKKQANIFMEDTFFQFRCEPEDQIKTWKQADHFDLKSSGGHRLKVKRPKIFPLRILNRHYPLRSIEQAKKKVFQDRKPRFKKEESDRGWHIQYDGIYGCDDFVFDPSDLILWDENIYNNYYIPLFTGCGIQIKKKNVYHFSVDHLKGKKIVLYGAGNVGKQIYCQLKASCSELNWLDQDYEYQSCINCERILSPEEIIKIDYDYIIVAIKNEAIYNQILRKLLSLGVEENCILWGWRLLDC